MVGDPPRVSSLCSTVLRARPKSNIHATGRRQEQVLRLQIAMRGLLVVGCGEPASNLCCDADGFADRHRPIYDLALKFSPSRSSITA